MGDSAGPAVLVVGAGPSGLFSAVELARHGVPSRVVERRPRPHREARATALQPGTLEILYRAGLLDQVLANSMHLGCVRIFDAELNCVVETPFAGAGCQWEFQCSLPQWRTEQLLTDRLTELGGTVHRGISVTSLTETDDHVRVELADADGRTEHTEVPWVIGAGGAHSMTRHSMHEDLPGSTYPGTALVAELAVRCGLPRDGGSLIATAAGYVLLVPLPGGRWLTFVGDLAEAELGALDGGSAPGAVAAAIGHRIPAGVEVADVGWWSTFRMHRRLAPHLADKRRFLLGDAGHLSSPFGGEGLNSGLHDASNLAWKLALEQRGRARPVLLDSFAIERTAADRHVLQVSDQMHELAYGAVALARAGQPLPAPPAPDKVLAAVRSRCMLDVSYPSSPLTGEHVQPDGPALPGPAPGDRYPDRTMLTGTEHVLLTFGPVPARDLDWLRRRWAGVLTVTEGTGDPRRAGLAGVGAVLIRPDGYVGFRAAPADHAGLTALDAHLDSYLIPAAG